MKMWFLIVTALVVASTALEEEDYCDNSPYALCDPGEGFKKFPESEEEFDEICPIVLGQFRCMQEYASKCDSSRLQRHTRFLEALQEVCRKDSRLHETIAKNIGCIKESVIKECSEKIRKVRQAYVDSLNVTGQVDWMKLLCMSDAYSLTCASDAVLAPCGSTVKTAILEMAQRADYLGRENKCPRSMREELIKDIPAMEISIAEKLRLEEILLEI
ncbi:uncharacterized protein LOC118202869 [Stegodyphus dumicola]|uniref:uncharacterized protein LOC118202869 n=1 Tax=Stegodyphus dumicola TaxID=202533 RepID=UPI0015ABBB85|nr:uncharacterized protein LOC118202869 [Stegodyphus dumicola]